MNWRWSIFLIFSLQYLLLYFHRVCPAVLVTEFTRDFGISGTALGLLSSAYFYPYSLMQIPVGILSDRWGARKTATVFGIIGASGVIMLALSNAIEWAMFSRILIGSGVSAIFIPAMTVFGKWFKPNEYARVSGAFMAIGTIGWYLGTAPLAALSEMFSWRLLFLSLGIITIFFTALTWLIIRDSPGDISHIHIKATKIVRENGRNSGLKFILTSKQFWPLAIWFFLRVGILFGFFGLWAGPYLMDVYKLQKVHAGNILSMVPLGIILGTPFFGYLSDKVFASRKVILVGSTLILCLCWILFVAFYDSLPLPVLYVLFFIGGMVTGSPAAVGFSAIKESFSEGFVGTTLGAINLAGFVGGLVFQPLMGYWMDTIGRVNGAYPVIAYRLPLFILLCSSFAALFSVLTIRETFQQNRGR